MRRLVALSLALLGAALWTGVALADDRQQSGYTYSSSDICVHNIVRTSHGFGYGQLDVHVESEQEQWTPWGGIGCGNTYERPPGYMTIRWEWWKWRPDLGRWVKCNYSGWQYNQSSNWYMTRTKVFFANQTCGPAWYDMVGGGFVWNGAWYGGWLWSGYHWFPA